MSELSDEVAWCKRSLEIEHVRMMLLKKEGRARQEEYQKDLDAVYEERNAAQIRVLTLENQCALVGENTQRLVDLVSEHTGALPGIDSDEEFESQEILEMSSFKKSLEMN